MASDLLKNKRFYQEFGDVPKGSHIPRRLWIEPKTVPYIKVILEATNADFPFKRGEKGPNDPFDITDEMRDSVVQRNQMPTSLTNFTPKNPSLLIYFPVKDGAFISNLEIKQDYRNTGWMGVWLPGFSADGKNAILKFFCGPSAHGMYGAYMLTKTGGRGWRIKWKYVLYHF